MGRGRTREREGAASARALRKPRNRREAAPALRFSFVGTAYPMRGGIAQFNALLCRELAREHEVSFFSFKRQYPSLFFPGKTQIEAGDDPAPVGARAIVDSIDPLNWRRAAGQIAREAPDALLFKYWMPFFAPCFGTIARRVKAKTGCKVVLICDNIVPHERRLLDGALTRYMLEASDAFIVMSKSVLDDLHRFRPDARVELVHHPLYTHFGEPMDRVEARRLLGWKEDDRVLLFFGFVRKYKGLDVLLRAMPRIRAATGARLVVLGEFYEDRAPYDRIVAELGLSEIVTMTGDYVPNESVGKHFSASDLVVLPYRSATQSGIVQVAYQLEIPVICTRVGGLEEMVRDGETGLLVPSEDEAALASAVAAYFHEGMEGRLVDGVRRVKREMGWDSLAASVVRLAAGARHRSAAP
jgi:glycosyltransferase involved in cell wall biosynthesis